MPLSTAWRRFGRSPTLAGLAAVFVAMLAACQPPGSRVAYIGDSLANEAAQSFIASVTQSHRAFVDRMTYPMTAPCDWLPLAALEGRRNPAAVVLSFSGNAVTPCMVQRLGQHPTPAQIAGVYQNDLAQLVQDFPHSRVYFALSPIARGYSSGPAYVDGSLPNGGPEIDAAIQAVATAHAATVVDAGAAVEAADHTFTDTLPCLPTETAADGCTNGVIPVRSPDGLHFRPLLTGTRVDGSCPGYSSGAVRYGTALAEPVVRDLHL